MPVMRMRRPAMARSALALRGAARPCRPLRGAARAPLRRQPVLDRVQPPSDRAKLLLERLDVVVRGRPRLVECAAHPLADDLGPLGQALDRLLRARARGTSDVVDRLLRSAARGLGATAGLAGAAASGLDGALDG